MTVSTHFTDDKIRELGYDLYINHGDFFVAVMKMTFGKGRIIYSESLGGIDNAWCYKTLSESLLALVEWEEQGVTPNSAPKGWFKNPITGELRDPTPL